MPITQGQMIEQMQEARALHRALVSLREAISAYAENAKARYPANTELQEVLTAIQFTIKAAPVPDDRATYVNERYYSRRGKYNVKAQIAQERKRREMGIPTKQEAMNVLRERRVQGQALAVEIATQAPRNPSLPDDPFSPATRAPSRPNIIFPRDDPDDKPLDFEGETSDSLFGKPREP